MCARACMFPVSEFDPERGGIVALRGLHCAQHLGSPACRTQFRFPSILKRQISHVFAQPHPKQTPYRRILRFTALWNLFPLLPKCCCRRCEQARLTMHQTPRKSDRSLQAQPRKRYRLSLCLYKAMQMNDSCICAWQASYPAPGIASLQQPNVCVCMYVYRDISGVLFAACSVLARLI